MGFVLASPDRHSGVRLVPHMMQVFTPVPMSLAGADPEFELGLEPEANDPAIITNSSE